MWRGFSHDYKTYSAYNDIQRRHAPIDTCQDDADCMDICGDKRAACRPHATMPDLKLCRCP